MCHLFGQKRAKVNFSKKTIKIEQLGLRRGLWGHSFKSSYSLELIFDFWEKSILGVFFLFLVPDIWYLIPDIWISGYLDIWYLDTWIPDI